MNADGPYIILAAIMVSMNVAFGCMNIASAIRELADALSKEVTNE